MWLHHWFHQQKIFETDAWFTSQDALNDLRCKSPLDKAGDVGYGQLDMFDMAGNHLKIINGKCTILSI
jgi:hypothetical protein